MYIVLGFPSKSEVSKAILFFHLYFFEKPFLFIDEGAHLAWDTFWWGNQG